MGWAQLLAYINMLFHLCDFSSAEQLQKFLIYKYFSVKVNILNTLDTMAALVDHVRYKNLPSLEEANISAQVCSYPCLSCLRH